NCAGQRRDQAADSRFSFFPAKSWKEIDARGEQSISQHDRTVRLEVHQLPKQPAGGIRSGQPAPAGAAPHSAFEFQHSRAGSNSGQKLTATNGNSESIVGAGGKPRRNIDGSRRVVQKNSINRIIRVVRKRVLGWTGDRASVQNNKVDIAELPPDGLL